jgi:hypothetical protein
MSHQSASRHEGAGRVSLHHLWCAGAALFVQMGLSGVFLGKYQPWQSSEQVQERL